MFCPNCGHDCDDNNKYCTNCGHGFEGPVPEEPARGESFAAKVTEILKSDLFLVLCILVSGSAFFSFMSGGINVFATLFTIFFWLLFSTARSKNIADDKLLRSVSGVVFAQKVVAWVAFGSSLLSCAIFFAASSYIDEKELIAEFEESAGAYIDLSYIKDVLESGHFFMICGIVFAVMAIAMLLYNVLVLRYVHGFTKSLYTSVEFDRNALDCVASSRTVLMVMGVILAAFTVLTMGGGFLTIMGNSCNAAAWIISSVIISKNFCE